jgi:hypothetical protein
MKSLILFLLIFVSSLSYSQSNCSTISDGNYGNTQTSPITPVYGLFNYSWSSAIYTAGNIGTAKTISYISWYVDEYQSGYSQTGPYTFSNVKIWFAYTTLSGWSNITNVSGVNRPTGVNVAQGITTWNKVFDGAITFSGKDYWQYIPLDTPYSYNGTTNLIVHVENWDGAWSFGYPIFHYTSTSASTIRTIKYGYQDASMGPTSGTRAYSRPDIQFCEATPLPIALLDFYVESLGNYNKVTWTTASEHNNDFFTIEKSNNGNSFFPITKYPGAGNSAHPINYSFFDYDVLPTINYYRLKQTDYNGDNETFFIVSVDNRQNPRQKNPIGIYNHLGQIVDLETYQGIYFILFDDGTIERVYKND